MSTKKQLFIKCSDNYRILGSEYQRLLRKYHNKAKLPPEFIDEIISDDNIYNYIIETLTEKHNRVFFYYYPIDKPFKDKSNYIIVTSSELKSSIELAIRQKTYSKKELSMLKKLQNISTYEYFTNEYSNKKIGNETIKSIISKLLSEDFINTITPEEAFDLYKKLINHPFNFYSNENLLDYDSNPIVKKETSSIEMFYRFSFPKDKQEIIENNFEKLINYLLLKQRIIPGISLEEILLNLLDKDAYYRFKQEKNPFGISREKLAEKLSKINFFKFNNDEIAYNAENYICEFYTKRIFSSFQIDHTFKAEILSEIPRKFTKTQKIYYIYRRLCQIFSYDEEFYISNQNKKGSINHNNPARFNSINKKNNKIICYEITLLLAKFAEILNIPYKIVDYSLKRVTEYGPNHTLIILFSDNFIINADASTGCIYSDLSNEKICKKLENFELADTKLENRIDFFNQLKEVDEYIKNRPKNYQHINIEAIAKSITPNMTFQEKKQLLFKSIASVSLEKMDFLSYIIYLNKALFSDSTKEQCRLSFIGTTVPNSSEKQIDLITVITMNPKKSITKSPKTNEYYIIENKKIKQISIDFLREGFKNGIYFYPQYMAADEKIIGVSSQKKFE